MFLLEIKKRLIGGSLIVVGFIALSWNLNALYKEMEEVKAIEQAEIELGELKALEKYFGVDLQFPLDDLKALPPVSQHEIVAGIDITLNDAIQKIQNNNFDTVYLNNDNKIAYVNIFLPDNLKQVDYEKFMFYQAMVYSTIIRKLNPGGGYINIGISAYPKNGAGSLRVMYDFNRVSNLMRFGFKQAYEFFLADKKKQLPS